MVSLCRLDNLPKQLNRLFAQASLFIVQICSKSTPLSPLYALSDAATLTTRRQIEPIPQRWPMDE